MTATTALVTGASTGIGHAFARALAARGQDLVIVARSAPKLEELATTVERGGGRSVEVLVADLETESGIATLEARLSDAARPVELLVNNAGFGTNGAFHELPIEGEVAEITCNVVALVRLTHAALCPMVARGHGGVINVSSLGAYSPAPRSATYGATKAYVSSFTNAVHEELRGTGVKAMVLAPGFTHTEFHVRADIDQTSTLPEFVWQTSEEVVDAALKAYDRGRGVCVPGALNGAIAAFASTAPAGVARRVAGMVTKRTY